MSVKNIKCTKCQRPIIGKVRWNRNQFKTDLEKYTEFFKILPYPDDSPFCGRCQISILNFKRRGPTKAEAENYVSENDHGIEDSMDVPMASENIDDSCHLNADYSDAQKTGNDEATKESKIDAEQNQWQAEFFALHLRISVMEEKLGFRTPEVTDWAYQEAVHILNHRTSLIEDALDSSQEYLHVEAKATYSESASSEFIFETEDYEPKQCTKKLKRENEHLVSFPARTLVHTERYCVVCNSSKNRGVVPFMAVVDLLITDQVLINLKSRSCRSHFSKSNIFTLEAKTLIVAKAHPGYLLRMTGQDLWQILIKLAEVSVTRKGLLSFKEETKEERFQLFLGVSKSLFLRLHDAISPYMRDTPKRSIFDALAILLAKLRLGISQKVLGFLFGIYSQPAISVLIHRVSKLLDEHVVPKYLGWKHMTREQALQHQQNQISSRIFNLPPTSLVMISDGTYVTLEKASNHELQYKTYCLFKHKNLVKMMMTILEDGYILDANGPWFSYSKNNDASILKSILLNTQNTKPLLRKDDMFILDRGFGEIITWIKEQDYHAVCPNFLPRGQKQFTSLQANENRCVTKVRFRVEVVNGRISNRWKFFAHVVELLYIPIVGRLFRICCALHNMEFKPILSDAGREDDIVNACLKERILSDTLMAEIKAKKLDTRRKCWEKVGITDVADFPLLAEDDLLTIDHGTYQISNAEEYVKRSEFFRHATLPLMKGKVQSRFCSGVMHGCYVEFTPNGSTSGAILRRACTCMSGLRMFGTCSHIMALLYLFGYRRHYPKFEKGPNFFNFVLDAADILARVENHVDSQAETEVEDDEIENPEILRFGIPNVGNSCYLNSCLQLLFTVPEVKRNLLYLKELMVYYNGVFERKLSIERAKDAKHRLFQAMKWTDNCIQHDAHEFLVSLINMPQMAEIKHLLMVKTGTVRTCACGVAAKNEQWELGFYFTPNESIQNQINASKDLVTGKCTCGLERISAQQSFLQLPKYGLVTHVIYDKHKKSENSRLEPVFTVDQGNDSAIYTLLACVTHIGNSMNEGHYKAYVISDKLLCYDDGTLSEVSKIHGDIYISLYRLE